MRELLVGAGILMVWKSAMTTTSRYRQVWGPSVEGAYSPYQEAGYSPYQEAGYNPYQEAGYSPNQAGSPGPSPGPDGYMGREALQEVE